MLLRYEFNTALDYDQLLRERQEAFGRGDDYPFINTFSPEMFISYYLEQNPELDDDNLDDWRLAELMLPSDFPLYCPLEKVEVAQIADLQEASGDQLGIPWIAYIKIPKYYNTDGFFRYIGAFPRCDESWLTEGFLSLCEVYSFGEGFIDLSLDRNLIQGADDEYRSELSEYFDFLRAADLDMETLWDPLPQQDGELYSGSGSPWLIKLIANEWFKIELIKPFQFPKDWLDNLDEVEMIRLQLLGVTEWSLDNNARNEGVMTPETARCFQYLIQNYFYPASRIVNAENKDADPHFADHSIHWIYDPGAHDIDGTIRYTSPEFDREIGDLLNSDDSNDNRRGIASVLYWGYFTFGDNYARQRVRRLLNPYNINRIGLLHDDTLKALSNARQMLMDGMPGEALSCFSNVSQLSRTPFASKVVAFLQPDRCGVLDNRIGRFLNEVREGRAGEISRYIRGYWDVHGEFSHGIGSVCNPTIARNYNAYCDFLSSTAGELNKTVYSWTYIKNRDDYRNDRRFKHTWRAIDVERAIFIAAKSKAAHPLDPN